jgi:G3E family GTPase
MELVMPRKPRIPVTIVTGLLGAGKTTLVNRIVTAHPGQRIAVIESERGERAVDHALVVRVDEELFELSRGCACCTVRGDLIRVLGDLTRRRDRFDRIIIETTGLADPGPVVQTLFVDDELQDAFRLDGVVTLIDAQHASRQLASHPEVRDQVAFADVLVINKLDLVDADLADPLERRLREINAIARVLRGRHGDVALAEVLEIAGFDLGRALAAQPSSFDPDRAIAAPPHDDVVTTIGLELAQPFDEARVIAWLRRLLQHRGHDILRMRGILALAGSARRLVVHGVHALLDTRLDTAWGDQPLRSQVVFIGTQLDREGLRAGLASCLA